MGKWKPDAHGGKIFIGDEVEHHTKLPSMKWLREQVPILDLVKLLGLKQRGKYIHCWHAGKHKHGDRTPSVGIDVRRNKVHCFVCSFDHSTIDLVMDVKQLNVKEAARWLASIWTSASHVEQKYQVRERMKWVPGKTGQVMPTHEWSKLKAKEIKKREKGYVEQLIGSRSWRKLVPATTKVMFTLLTLTEPKTLTVTVSTRDLAVLVGMRRARVISALKAIKEFGMYASETVYDKVNQRNKTKTYRLTWYSQAWQGWLRGKLTSTTTIDATCITVSQTDHPGSPEATPPVTA